MSKNLLERARIAAENAILRPGSGYSVSITGDVDAFYRNVTRAVIEAIREPSDEALNAAVRVEAVAKLCDRVNRLDQRGGDNCDWMIQRQGVINPQLPDMPNYTYQQDDGVLLKSWKAMVDELLAEVPASSNPPSMQYFIETSIGEDLDRCGEFFRVRRNDREYDTDYRGRIRAERERQLTLSNIEYWDEYVGSIGGTVGIDPDDPTKITVVLPKALDHADLQAWYDANGSAPYRGSDTDDQFRERLKPR